MLEMDLMEFFRSEVIWGRERSLKVNYKKNWPPPYYIFLESWEKVLQGFILILGVKGHLRSLENIKGQKSKKINPHQVICFWKPETELEMDLLEFLRSEVIGGHWRLSEDFEGQHTFHNSWIFWMCFSDDLCFVPHLYPIGPLLSPSLFSDYSLSVSNVPINIQNTCQQ